MYSHLIIRTEVSRGDLFSHIRLLDDTYCSYKTWGSTCFTGLSVQCYSLEGEAQHGSMCKS